MANLEVRRAEKLAHHKVNVFTDAEFTFHKVEAEGVRELMLDSETGLRIEVRDDIDALNLLVSLDGHHVGSVVLDTMGVMVSAAENYGSPWYEETPPVEESPFLQEPPRWMADLPF
jgi:hypothetical protein